MEKMTRRWKFDSQIEQFKQLKTEANNDIKKVESLSLTADYGIKKDIDSIVKKIVDVLSLNQKKLRDDPEYQEAIKYRKKLLDAKKDYESASKEYQEKYEWEYNSKIREIDELRHDERTKSKQLEEEFNLWWPTLESARAQNWENFEKKIKTLREDSDYLDALSAKKNLIKLKLRLVEALKDYEKELDIDNEELSEKEEKNIVERRRKVRTIENVNKTLSNLWINSEKVDWVILPTSIDWKKIIKKNDSNDLQIIEEINYPNKIKILFSKVFDDLWFSWDDYNVVIWKLNKNMVRKWSYIVVEVSSINKTIIINNLYWEATFLCDNIFQNKEYLELSKEDLLKKYPDTVTKLDFYDEDLWIEYIKNRLMTKNWIENRNTEVVKTELIKTELIKTEKVAQVNNWWIIKKRKYISGMTEKEENELLDKYSNWDLEARDQIFWAYRDKLKDWLDKIIKKNDYDYEIDIEDLYQESDIILLEAIKAFIDDENTEKNLTVFIRSRFYDEIEKYINQKYKLGVRNIDSKVLNNSALTEDFDNEGLHVRAVSKGENSSQNNIEDASYDPLELLEELRDSYIESNPEKKQILSELKEELIKIMDLELYQKEKDVLILYFWLNWETPMALDEIWDKLELSRERIRQIKERALKRLRHSRSTRGLRWYLEFL